MSDLLTETKELFGKRPAYLSYKNIAESTGLSEAWIKKFATLVDLDPRVSHVQKLYNYLKDLK
jgi:predicted transcriptional regulator